MHLQECLFKLSGKIEESISTIDFILSRVQLPLTEADSTAYGYIDELNLCKTDLAHLKGLLHGKVEETIALRTRIKEQLEHSHSYRDIIIAILVAIYVPLSFASVRSCTNLLGDRRANVFKSLFGMNIADNSQVHFETRTNTSHHSDADSSLSEHTFTHTSTNQPSTRTWDFSVFWAVALPLAFGTIVVPLTLGPTFR